MQIHQIPIINYHKISASYDIGITTRHPIHFENDLKILKENKFNSVTFSELLNNTEIPENPVIITFDDAYKSIIELAMPLMLSYGFKGVVYPVVKYIGQFNDWDVQAGSLKFKHLSWQNLKEMQRSGFEIGSHTLTHELLTWMNPVQQLVELGESKKQLDDQLGICTCSVSYPFGRFNKDTMACAREAGYQFGLASIYLRTIEDQIQTHALKRFNIYRFDTSNQFKKKISLKENNGVILRDWLIQKGGLGTAILQSVRKQLRSNGQAVKA